MTTRGRTSHSRTSTRGRTSECGTPTRGRTNECGTTTSRRFIAMGGKGQERQGRYSVCSTGQNGDRRKQRDSQKDGHPKMDRGTNTYEFFSRISSKPCWRTEKISQDGQPWLYLTSQIEQNKFFQTDVPAEQRNCYQELKDKVLYELGDTPQAVTTKWWSLST